MKFSLLSRGQDGAFRLSLRDANWFFQRIQTDTKQLVINEFREQLPTLEHPYQYRHYAKIRRICFAAEMKRQANGALTFSRYNGLVLLDVKPLAGQQALDSVKRAAMTSPATLAAFTGASGRSVKILVRVADAEGHVPQDEAEAEAFYATAYQRIQPLYDALIAPAAIARSEPHLKTSVLMPFDPEPLVNTEAVPMRIESAGRPSSDAGTDALTTLYPPPRHVQQNPDADAYEVYERIYGTAARQALKDCGLVRPDVTNSAYITALAGRLAEAGVPQEEAVTHIINHHRYKEGFSESTVRDIAEAVFDEEVPDYQPASKAHPGAIGEPMRELIRRLEQRYAFRYNTVMGYTEIRQNTTWISEWTPVNERVMRSLTLEMRSADLDIWDRDIRRYVMSTRIRTYNPVEDYLFGLKWDKRHDYIRDLARTVPTDLESWPDRFHTWFLGMVAQWTGRSVRYGNAIVPLLVSAQGFHKSDFCRRLLPPELRRWGYSDNLSFADDRQVYLQMTQMLLINLDEFNAISPKRQEGFLKNMLQLPTVKVKRPYASHVEDIPRLASFIATTNMADVLADPSGSRRFIGVNITAPIDVSQTPNYDQLYAQAVYELHNRERHWFDAKETEAIMRDNRCFHTQSDALAFFWEMFRLATNEHEPGAQWMTAAAILSTLKAHARGVFHAPSTIKLGRELRGIPDMIHKTTNHGEAYLVCLL